jgi:hypothetical protein
MVSYLLARGKLVLVMCLHKVYWAKKREQELRKVSLNGVTLLVGFLGLYFFLLNIYTHTMSLFETAPVRRYLVEFNAGKCIIEGNLIKPDLRKG